MINSQVDNNDKIFLILSGADVATVGISEARYMFNCIQKRMPSTFRSQVNIFLDENSTNTLGNALNCCKIISDQVRTQNPDIHHVALVTNEFHMPRAHLLFKSALRNSQVRIHALPAENGLAPGNEYRPLSNRPVDANEWTVRERLDWEWNGLCSLEPLLQSDHDNDDDDCHGSGDNIGSVKGKGSGSGSGSGSSSGHRKGLLTIRQEDLDVAKEQIRKLNETNYQNDSRSPLIMKYFIPSNLSTWQ
eukprot:gene27794-36621_t